MSSLNRRDNLSTIFATFWEKISPKVDAYAIPSIQARIEDWAGAVPELAEVLCAYAVQYASRMRAEDAELTVDKIVRDEIVRDWESSLAAPHLSQVREAILRHDRRDSLLISYIQVLQRGKVQADDSPEQMALIGSGLLLKEGREVRVASRLYKEVFDLVWVEQQIPGITKPVTIVSPNVQSNAPSASTKLYSKLAIAACGLALVGAAVSSYIRESGGEAMATPDGLEAEVALVENTSRNRTDEAASLGDASNRQVEPAEDLLSDRALFDSGEEHAKNSRWVRMMRDFCKISPESAYFEPAQKDLVQWKALYPEDLAIAVDVVVAEEGEQCAVASLASEE